MAKKDKFEDWLKANRKASREIELENEKGWKAKHKVHSSKKEYKRKPKHKNKIYEEIFN